MTQPDARPLPLMTEEEHAFHTCRDRDRLFAMDEAGRTLLHIAAQGGKAAVCRMYLSAGIDPTKVDNSGRTAADLAKLAGYASLSRSLETAIASQAGTSGSASITGNARPLDVREQSALIAGEVDVLVGLIAAKRLDCQNAKGDTPLHLAAAGGHLRLCSHLFEAGANTTIQNNSGHTPADMAFEAGHRQLADVLCGLSRGKHDAELQSGASIVETEAFGAEVPKSEIEDALDELEFDTEEEPVAFHARQDIDIVSATFVAIPSGSGLRVGDTTDDVPWELPSILLKARATDHLAVWATDNLAGANAWGADFSSSNGRSTRQPRKLKNTCFSIDELVCRRWVQDRLTTGETDDQAIRDLVAECSGNQSDDELSVNVRKALEAAGVQIKESSEPFLQIPSTSTFVVDEFDLVEAIEATCTRNTIVPGRQAFNVDRATEERLVREISNARHELLNAILEDPELLSAIILRSEKLLRGEIAVDAFTDLEIEVSDEEEVDPQFSANLETLREAQETGIAMDGRARRKVLEALDGLELARTCLNDLTQHAGEKTGKAIGFLLAACDRTTEAFLLAHLPFARRETAKMALPNEDAEELFQEAYFAIRRASERFDPGRGVRFYVYALYWIRQQISRWRMNNLSMIRVPVHRYEIYANMSAYRLKFIQQFYREPTFSEISTHLECDIKTINAIEFALSEPLEFYRAMSDRADSGDSPEELARHNQSERLIRHELEELDGRQNEILRMRFGIGRDDDMTLEEIGQIYGVTRERIRQIEAKALKRLGHPGRLRFLRELL